MRVEAITINAVIDRLDPLPENSLLLGVNVEDKRLSLLINLAQGQLPLLIVADFNSRQKLKAIILEQSNSPDTNKRVIILEGPENINRLERALEFFPSIIFGPGLTDEAISALGLTEEKEITLVKELQPEQIAARTFDNFDKSGELLVYNTLAVV